MTFTTSTGEKKNQNSTDDSKDATDFFNDASKSDNGLSLNNNSINNANDNFSNINNELSNCYKNGVVFNKSTEFTSKFNRQILPNDNLYDEVGTENCLETLIKCETLRNSTNTNFLNHPSSLKLARYEIKSYSEFISGYIAACTSLTLLFPLNKIIFRQILDGISLKEAVKQIKSDGVANFYRGLLPPLLQKSTSYSIMFGTQNEYFLVLNKYCDKSELSVIKSMSPELRKFLTTGISGAMAGLTEATLTPFERVQSILQMKQFHDSYKNTLDTFQAIKQNHGVKELYRGLSAICVRNSCANALFFTSRAPLKSLFPTPKNNLQNSMYDFINGGLLGACISTIIYPFNIIKSHMQARVGGEFHGIVFTFKQVYDVRDRKLSLLFKGVGSNFTRAVLAWGITNAAYEYCLNRLKIYI